MTIATEAAFVMGACIGMAMSRAWSRDLVGTLCWFAVSLVQMSVCKALT